MIRIAVGFLIAAILLLMNDFFLFESVLVPSESMIPTLLPNERVFLQKIGTGPYSRYDVVVVRVPGFKKRLIKRVIALPGECVEIEDGWKVIVNHRALQYTPAEAPAMIPAAAFFQEDGHHPVRVIPRSPGPEKVQARAPKFLSICLKSNEVFVLGDNRLNSEDSRWFGPVPLSQVEGRATRIWYSFSRFKNSNSDPPGMRWQRLGLPVR